MIESDDEKNSLRHFNKPKRTYEQRFRDSYNRRTATNDQAKAFAKDDEESESKKIRLVSLSENVDRPSNKYEISSRLRNRIMQSISTSNEETENDEIMVIDKVPSVRKSSHVPSYKRNSR